MRNQNHEDFSKMMEQGFQEIIGVSSFEEMQQMMSEQTAKLRELAIQQNQNSYLKDGPRKLSVLESKMTLEEIININNNKYKDWCSYAVERMTDRKYLKGNSYILNAYYNPNPVIEILTNSKKGSLYKNTLKDISTIIYSYDLDQESLPVRTIIRGSLSDSRCKEGYYIRRDKEELFLLFNGMDHKIEAIYRAIYNDNKVVHYEEAVCNYDNTEHGTIASMDRYDINYERDELKGFALYRYDGSEYIYWERYELDPSRPGGLRRKYDGE